MAITKAQTTVWSAKVKVEAQEASMALFLANKEYQSEAIGTETVKVIGVNAPAITDYVKATGITSYDDLVDTEIDINIDVWKKFNYVIQDQDIAQSTPDYVPAGLIQAGNALGLTGDAVFFGSTVYGNASIPAANKIGSIGSSVALTAANIQQQLGKLATALRKQHIARGNMYCVLPPDAFGLLNEASWTNLTDNKTEWASGQVYEYAGMKIVESTEVAAAGSGSDEYQIMAFSPRAIAMVTSMKKVESMMNPSDFGEILRGLFGFGVEVIFPKELAILSATVA